MWNLEPKSWWKLWKVGTENMPVSGHRCGFFLAYIPYCQKNLAILRQEWGLETITIGQFGIANGHKIAFFR